MGIWIPGGLKGDDSGGGTGYVPSSWSEGTDVDIARALEAHYNDEIDLSEYWSVGDERIIHLDSMTAPNPNSSNTWLAQDITVVIVDFDHTDLATAINGHDKACITVQTKEVLSGTAAGTAGTICVNGDNSYDMSFTKWSNLYMRTYLNDIVWGAFPADFKSMIKPSKHYRHTTYNGSASEEVTDNLFLPSYPEIFGTESYSNYVPTSPTEGTQLAYYASGDSTRKIKYGNNNGSPNSTKASWYMGSANSIHTNTGGYFWCYVGTGGAASYNRGDGARGLAPAFVM